MNRIDVLGVPIDACSEREVLLKIAGMCTSEGQFHIATPNPEMIVEAQKNAEFREVLRNADLNLADGTGVVWAMRRGRQVGKSASRQVEKIQGGNATCRPVDLSTCRPQRITGTDTLIALCSSELRICPPETVFLLGAAPGIAEKAANELRERNPALKIVGTHSGSPNMEDEAEIVQKINEASPTLLFVAFGAPEQELWIARNLSKLKTVKVAMGIGGAFDFLAGKQKRAPKVLRSVGLEWLWRLLLEPRRIKRIWRAVVVFPCLVLTRK